MLRINSHANSNNCYRFCASLEDGQTLSLLVFATRWKALVEGLSKKKGIEFVENCLADHILMQPLSQLIHTNYF